jgi:HD-GYP domain-containing protein (c-di-GMP phosphodiesterase class II)
VSSARVDQNVTVAEGVRLVEVLGALSLASDAADGFPPETTMRSAILAGALAEGLGDRSLVADVVVAGLLRHIGCTAFSPEEAHEYGAGDDVGLRRTMAGVDFGQPDRAVELITTQLAASAPPAAREAAVAAILTDGATAGARHDAAQCDAAERLTALLPVTSGARVVATDAFERWDGYGGPTGKTGEGISLVARIVEVAYVAELFRGRQGRGGARAEVRARAGGQLDPAVVDAFLDRAPELFALIDDPRESVWNLLLAAEPAPWSWLAPTDVEAAALAFARFADLKSTWFTGHSEAVAELAVSAATVVGLDELTASSLRCAALLHDLGRVAVPTGTWDAPRQLSGPERDRVRFHSWETQRILAATPLLADVAPIAGAAHERNDGTGYHRGLPAAVLGRAERLLAAADVACALREHRPHRKALAAREAHRVLREEVDAGRLDRSAVSAVIEAGGGPPAASPKWPAGLTAREIDVLRLVAGGAANKDISRALGISAKTVAHHVAHIYDKTGCRSRAGTTLYALEQGLLGPGGGGT